jgi:hypothetical protein
MLRAVRKFFAWKQEPRAKADEYHERHRAWDRECRARGMTAREQADELQVRAAWLRLRRKASAKVLQQPRRFREILDRVAADEARTLAAIGGGELAAHFLRAYAAAGPLDILSPEAAFVVRAEAEEGLVTLDAAPSLMPELPAGEPREKPRATRAKQRQKATAG